MRLEPDTEAPAQYSAKTGKSQRGVNILAEEKTRPQKRPERLLFAFAR